jgi:uncharacterized protein YeaO (DUF488 family)
VIRLKRAYDAPAHGDGTRVLVDRVWPRGISRENIKIEAWLPDLGPSTALRTWFGHDPSRWETFRRRYLAELKEKRPLLQQLAAYARRGTLTLVFGARDPAHNQAVVIKEALESRGGVRARRLVAARRQSRKRSRR